MATAYSHEATMLLICPTPLSRETLQSPLPLREIPTPPPPVELVKMRIGWAGRRWQDPPYPLESWKRMLESKKKLI